MVYFNCGQCGTGLKKSQVEQHMYQCKSRLFSCIDCQKDFKNYEYKAHVKCLTESERYESKSSYVAKPNKGEVKQNAWFEKVLKAVETFKGSMKAKSLLEKMTDYPNVPRKKAKFFNFARNSFRSFGVNDSQIDEIWTVIETIDKAEKANNQANGHNNKINHSNGTNMKRKLENENEQLDYEPEQKKSNKTNDESKNNDELNVSFDWVEMIKNQCIKNENNQISLIKLEKKLFKKYKNLKDDQEEVLPEKFNKKLNKKLKKLSDLFDLLNENDENQSIIVKYKNDMITNN